MDKVGDQVMVKKNHKRMCIFPPFFCLQQIGEWI